MTDAVHDLRDALTQQRENSYLLGSNGIASLPTSQGIVNTPYANGIPFYLGSNGHLEFGFGLDLVAGSSAALTVLKDALMFALAIENPNDPAISSAISVVNGALSGQMSYSDAAVTLDQYYLDNYPAIDWRLASTVALDTYYNNFVLTDTNIQVAIANSAPANVLAGLEDFKYNANSGFSTITGLSSAIAQGDWAAAAFDIVDWVDTQVDSRRAAESLMILGFSAQSNGGEYSPISGYPDNKNISSFMQKFANAQGDETVGEDIVLPVLQKYTVLQGFYVVVQGDDFGSVAQFISSLGISVNGSALQALNGLFSGGSSNGGGSIVPGNILYVPVGAASLGPSRNTVHLR